MSENRIFERIKPVDQLLVKEDTGEVINYYYLKDISKSGMYLLRKIGNDNTKGKRSSFTFMSEDLINYSVEGILGETRLNTGEEAYGTAVQFTSSDGKTLDDIVNFIKAKKENRIVN